MSDNLSEEPDLTDFEREIKNSVKQFHLDRLRKQIIRDKMYQSVIGNLDLILVLVLIGFSCFYWNFGGAPKEKKADIINALFAFLLLVGTIIQKWSHKMDWNKYKSIFYDSSPTKDVKSLIENEVDLRIPFSETLFQLLIGASILIITISKP